MILLRLPNTCFPSIQPLFFFSKSFICTPESFRIAYVAGCGWHLSQKETDQYHARSNKKARVVHPRALGLSLSCIAQKIKWGGKRGHIRASGTSFNAIYMAHIKNSGFIMLGAEIPFRPIER